jgi:hypothetical protein
MAAKIDNKKQLEELLGHKLGADAMKLINLFQSVASSTRSPGSTTKRHLLINRPNQCYQTELLDVSGFAVTGSDGTSTFRLSNFICHAGERFTQPINVVATPFSTTPCFLTMVHSLVNDGDDVEIKVSSWDAAGAAAPLVAFNWRCRVELLFIILKSSPPC